MNPWTVVHKAPLSMGLPRQEHWSGLPLLSPGDLPHPGIESTSPVLAAGFFNAEPPGIVLNPKLGLWVKVLPNSRVLPLD